MVAQHIHTQETRHVMNITPRIDISPGVICKTLDTKQSLQSQHEQTITKTVVPSPLTTVETHDPCHSAKHVLSNHNCNQVRNHGEKGAHTQKDIPSRKEMEDLLSLPLDEVQCHTPKTFQALFDCAIVDPQLKPSPDMLKIAQNPDYPSAKRRKISNKTPLQLRTYT